jgi:predicted mannosyl-3-phosphoglycerate phosphatase (HAD superfamily)
MADGRPAYHHLMVMDVDANARDAATQAAVLVFARVGDRRARSLQPDCPLPRYAVKLLCAWGARLVLVSACGAEYVRNVQRELRIREAFVCEGGAALHVPESYRGKPVTPRAEAEWEIFRFNPPDRFAAVTMVRDLFLGRGWNDVLTIGVGCDWDDYGVLAAVEVPVVVRDLRKDQSGLLRYVPGAYLTTATGPDGWAEALIGP